MVYSKNHFRANDGVRAIIIALLFGSLIFGEPKNHAKRASWLHETKPSEFCAGLKMGEGGA